MALLKAENLTKIYSEGRKEIETRALDGIELSVEKGEFIAVMGPSGSGKSTLVSILSGILSPSTGKVNINGKSINEMSPDQMALFRRRELGFVFQEFNLLDHLTVKENIILPMVLDKKPKDEMDKAAESVMKLLGIESIGDKHPYSISGGQQQRAAVCRSLINDPCIIFADEPTGNLDSKSSNAVMKCFEKINENNNATILMVTHDVFAASFCKKVIFIKDGKISMNLNRKGTRKQFFDEILDYQAIVGGEQNEV